MGNLLNVITGGLVGGSYLNGLVSVEGTDGKAMIQLQAFDKEAVIGAGQDNGRPGRLTMVDGNLNQTVNLTAVDATLTLGSAGTGGSAGTDGTVTVKGKDGVPRVVLNAGGPTAGTDGMVSVQSKDGWVLVQLQALDTEAVIIAGQGKNGRPGRLTMFDGKGNPAVNLTATDATLKLGGAGTDGTVTLFGKDGQPCVAMAATATESVISAGQKNGRPGRLSMYDGNGNGTIDLNAAKGNVQFNGNLTVLGDVFLPGADCAEQFDIAGGESVEPGTVVVMDLDGAVRESTEAYDKRVAGVVSGAGYHRHAIVLDHQASCAGRAPIGLVGKIYCKVDAAHSPIELGDLLTTSPTPGHAMKAGDPFRGFGAVLGKALRPWRSGRGLIPILIALQ